MAKKQLVIEIPGGWTQLGPLTFAAPLEEVGTLFNGSELMRATAGIPTAIVDSLCDDFVHQIQRQLILRKLDMHEEDVKEKETAEKSADGISRSYKTVTKRAD